MEVFSDFQQQLCLLKHQDFKFVIPFKSGTKP